MIYNIDLYSRLESAFGFAVANAVNQLESSYVKTNMTTFTDGNKGFADVILTSSSGKKYEFLTGGKLTGIDGLVSPPPMLGFSRQKNISKTIIDNSDFEVVENFGKKSWQITMQGILVDMEKHWYPQELLKKVRELFEIDEILNVTGQIFIDLGIKSIYIENLNDLSFVEGYNDTIKYSLMAYSIKPTEFQML